MKGREFVKRNKAWSRPRQEIDTTPNDVRSADYDATMEMMTADGTEDAEHKVGIEIAKRMPTCS